MRCQLATAAIALLLLSCSLVQAVYLFHLSDFHMDPEFGTEHAIGPCKNSSVSLYGIPGCDSSQEQVRHVLANIRRVAETLDDEIVVIYTGDWLRHGMNELPHPHQLALSIMSNLTHLIKENLLNATTKDGRKIRVAMAPHFSIPVSLGNEDFIPDYHFNVSEPSTAKGKVLLQRFGSIFHEHSLLTRDEADTFSHCGYYDKVFSLSNASLRTISLNTLIWSKDISPPTSGMADPCGQFSWLAQKLNHSRINGDRVIIQSHIPPLLTMWDSTFFSQYLHLLKEYNDVIAAQFYGHIHRISFLAMTKDNSVSPLFIGGPITRISHTNPSYELMELDDTTLAPQSLTVHLLDADQNYKWVPKQQLPQYYNISGIDTASLHAFGMAMRNDPSGRADFVAWYTLFNGGVVSPQQTAKCDSLCQRTYACSTICTTDLDAALCLL